MNRAKILLDADVLIHFIKGEQHLILHKIFPKNPLVILEPVYDELIRYRYTAEHVNFLLLCKSVEKLPFPDTNPNVLLEYARLKSEGNGTGESACMAVARYDDSYIASSNLRDILPYCDTHEIVYLTTMDFLCEARNNGLLSEAECNDFIKKVKSKRSKLPVDYMKDYTCREREE